MIQIRFPCGGREYAAMKWLQGLEAKGVVITPKMLSAAQRGVKYMEPSRGSRAKKKVKVLVPRKGAGTSTWRTLPWTYGMLQHWGHQCVAKAVKMGLLPNLNTVWGFCSQGCGKRAQVYDHRDYFKPLEVTPVCWVCNLRMQQGKPGLGWGGAWPEGEVWFPVREVSQQKMPPLAWLGDTTPLVVEAS